MTEPSSSGLGAADPDLCRVSVIGGNTQVDLGLPATVPIAAYITDVVELIESRNPDLSEQDEAAPPQTQHWTLARIGRDPIPPNRTLTEAEVYDGELLVLRSVTAKEAPALFDDVIDAVSKLTTESFRSWSPVSARWMGLIAGLFAILASLALLAIAKSDDGGVAPGAIALGVGLVAIGAAAIGARRYPESRLVTVMLSLYAVLLVFGGTGMLVPNDLASPHALLACVAALVAAAACYSLTRMGATLFAAVVTITVFAGVSSLVHMVWEPELYKIAAGVLVAGLITITLAPRLAVAAARLPVPPVPTAGGAIDPADHEPRPTIADIGAIGATALPSAVGLEQRARAANDYQSGMIIGCTLAIAVSAVVAADPLGSGRWQGIALGVVLALILCLRGRSFADLTQASTLIAGGAATLIAVLIGVGIGHDSWLLATAGVLLVVAAGAVGFGVVGPHTEMSPVVRRTGEIFEYLLICTIIPLVLWIMDLYSAARNL
ncbi:type VII secretion integral membrane protein EccD [Nocardia transvalensis]|uniref:type VII secretion integral membrane protein EccD n=1 Tax=Nocardia transvalensis TaxID=37333 RepID=UPI001894FC5A|nr:type VII secretion integral membrane protein EccD [Nocardia transvalensis]MBF6327515.1 type VII secretion integral membrane protein EccD [Nocardia transvalensis]